MRTIRIWNGPQVVNLVTVYRDGGSVTGGATGGAGNSTKVDVELDPWDGTIVDHSVNRSPVCFRDAEVDAPTEESVNTISTEMFSEAMSIAYGVYDSQGDPHSSALAAAVKAAFESAGLTVAQ